MFQKMLLVTCVILILISNISIHAQENWTILNSGTSKNIRDIAYGNGTLVAVGEAGLVCTSTNNGQTWTVVNTGITGTLQVVAFGKSAFVAVEATGLHTSTDNGKTWTKTNSSAYVDVTFGNGIFVAIGNTSTKGILKTSTDGVNWTSQNPNPDTNGIHSWEILSDITFANGKFEIVGRGLVIITMMGVSIPHQHEGFIMDSNDGKKWGRESYGDWDGTSEKYKYLKFVYDLTNKFNFFVAIGESNSIYTSTRFTWTAKTTGTNYYSLVWGKNQLVAVGENGAICSSGNAIDWIRRNSPTTKSLRSILITTDSFFAVGDNGCIIKSGETTQAPTADFTANPTSGTAPLIVLFNNASAGDITSYLWDFGDGQTSTSKNPSHTYQNAGAYTVKLTVTGTGGSDTKARTNYINVKSQPGESKFIEIASDSPGDALNSLPRDVYAGCDLDKDGKKEILVTNYADGGKVHVFEVIGDNKIELVWSSKGTSSTNQYTARSVKIGDLDNNGLQEILVPMARTGNPNDHGLHVFEWDGKNDNGYGDGLPISTFKVAQNWESGSTETIAVGDIDNDGKQEVVYPNNGDGSDDCVFIISCDGKFSQKNIRWKIEAEFKRADGYFGGSPNSSVIGDLDKDGHKEAIIGIWDYAAFLILESTGPDNFVKRAYVKTNPDLDDVCYKTIVIDDFDNDNRDDIIFTLRNSNKIGVVHQISSFENLNNNPLISYIYNNEIGQLYSLAYSDQDNDGEPNIFATQYKNGGILNIQYDGSGDRLSSLNYVAQQLFVDETGNSEGSFAISAPAVDLDGDNLKEVIVTFLEAKGTSAKWLRVFEHNGGKSGVQNWQVITPEDYILNQNYPNPFNSSTEISFKLPTYKNITLEIFDITGKLTKTLIGNQTISEGYHRISWDGTNNNGENIPSGVYVYRLSYGNFSTSKRLTLVK